MLGVGGPCSSSGCKVHVHAMVKHRASVALTLPSSTNDHVMMMMMIIAETITVVFFYSSAVHEGLDFGLSNRPMPANCAKDTIVAARALQCWVTQLSLHPEYL